MRLRVLTRDGGCVGFGGGFGRFGLASSLRRVSRGIGGGLRCVGPGGVGGRSCAFLGDDDGFDGPIHPEGDVGGDGGVLEFRIDGGWDRPGHRVAQRFRRGARKAGADGRRCDARADHAGVAALFPGHDFVIAIDAKHGAWLRPFFGLTVEREPKLSRPTKVY